ncbi:DCC1-like thiol-disulfide oxidoreductase family protein [Aureimonas leprariae]|uniref:DUF393 domain-containing protein n=1 Tax=Plantimonas leprariae TaxID=2615207 RepID=A0A7V7PK27_9HYPH|nr:DCC1-like thiol-disulfide oxidoreductase family protein [Aureimonas leprariae]KAB0675925.1 DUF393 domain-containing protein [Aureimonas leprariae]
MTDKALIIYDGECVYCQNYVKFVRLRETVGPVELLDARSGDPRILEFQRQGHDLDEGMLFVWKGTVSHGSDAAHLLATLSTDSTWFNTVNKAVFSNKFAASVFYPLLKLGRRVTLKLRGRSMIGHQR